MSSFYVKILAGIAGLLSLSASALGDGYFEGQPSLLPAQVSPTSYHGHNHLARARNQGQVMVDNTDDVAPVPPGNDYEQAMQSDWSGCESCCDLGGGGCGGGWYGYVGGLIMTRDDSNRVSLTCTGLDDALVVLDTRSADWSWYGGFEATIGHRFNCGRNGVEVTYFGLFPGDEETTVYGDDVPGGLKGALDWFRLQYNGEFANFWVDGAAAHRLQRDFEIHNVEVNLLSFHSHACSRWNWSWLAGARFFKFDEDLLFTSDLYNSDFAGDPSELNYLIDTENNLIGFQVGGSSRYWVSKRLSLNLGTKLGIYGNHIRQRQFIGGTAGPALVNNIFSSEFGNPVDVDVSKNDVAFLGELNVGASFWLTRNLSATFGYRALAVTGVALPSDQIVTHPDALGDMRSVGSAGSMILHGGYAGLEFRF